jgi:hypothetical protein
MNCKEIVNNFSRDRTRNEGERTYQDDLRALQLKLRVSGMRIIGNLVILYKQRHHERTAV